MSVTDYEQRARALNKRKRRKSKSVTMRRCGQRHLSNFAGRPSHHNLLLHCASPDFSSVCAFAVQRQGATRPNQVSTAGIRHNRGAAENLRYLLDQEPAPIGACVSDCNLLFVKQHEM